jgi:hypothetical protein
MVGGQHGRQENFREIIAQKQDAQTYQPFKTYKITVITGDRRGAGTDGNVYATIVGNNGQSLETKLDNDLNNFERAKKDIFQIQSESLGEIQKLRLRLEPKGLGSDWLLDKVIIESESEKKSWFFISGEWFDSKNLTREIPASGADGVGCAPMETYEIMITTGKHRGSGTDANVFIQIYGEKGDSGKHFLDSGLDDFERGRVCILFISGQNFLGVFYCN